MRIPLQQSLGIGTSQPPQVKNLVGHVIDVYTPAKSLRVRISGIGCITVKTNDTFDFGTVLQPKMHRGYDVRVEYNSLTGEYLATTLISTTGCVPTTSLNVPNIPLPAYTPKPTTFPPFPPFPISLPPLPNWTPLQVPTVPGVLPTKPGITPRVIPQGKGDLLYMSSQKGIAKCINAYSGTPSWASINGTLAGSALNIYWFTFDPFSYNGTNFTKIWAMTGDGLYLCTGLPGSPSWSQKLSRADAATLIGELEADTYLCNSFASSPFVANYVQVMVATNATTPGGYRKTYAIYTDDAGANWYADTTTALGLFQLPASVQANGILIPSGHIANRFHWNGILAVRSQYLASAETIIYETNHHVADVYRKSGNYYYYGFSTFNGTTGSGCNWWFPYCNGSGGIYPNDNVGYSYGQDHTGTSAIRRYTTLENPLWNPSPTNDYRTSTNVGDSTMTGGVDWFFTNQFNENYAVAMRGNYGGGSSDIWFTRNRGVSWTRTNNLTISGRRALPSYLVSIPSNVNYWYFGGKQTLGSGYGMAFKTENGGTSFTDISRLGEADGIDTVLSLSASGDLDYSQIQVDYWRT